MIPADRNSETGGTESVAATSVEFQAPSEPPCDGRCDGRLEVDPWCSRHGDAGRDYFNLRQMRDVLESRLHTFARDHEVAEDGSYGPEGNEEMSERISFTYEELKHLSWLLSEARESLDEDSTEEELRLSNQISDKHRRAFSKAHRKREQHG